MTAAHGLAIGCYLLGVALVVGSALLAPRLPHAEDRLHLLSPMTTLGSPLVGLGLVLQRGWTLASLEIALTCLLVAVTGPVLSSAAARVIAMQEGAVPRETPE